MATGGAKPEAPQSNAPQPSSSTSVAPVFRKLRAQKNAIPAPGKVMTRRLSAISSSGDSCDAWKSLNHRPTTASSNIGNGAQAMRGGRGICEGSPALCAMPGLL